MESPSNEDEYEEHDDDDDADDKEEEGEEEYKQESTKFQVSNPLPPTSTDMNSCSTVLPPPTSNVLTRTLSDLDYNSVAGTDTDICQANGTVQPSTPLDMSRSNKKPDSLSNSKFNESPTWTSHATGKNGDLSRDAKSPSSTTTSRLLARAPRAEFLFLAAAWLVYFVYAIAALGLFEKGLSLGLGMREVPKRLLGSDGSSSSDLGLTARAAGWFGSIFHHDRPVIGLGRGQYDYGTGNWFANWASSTSPRVRGMAHRSAGRWS